MSNCETDCMSEMMTNMNFSHYCYCFVCFCRVFVITKDYWLLLYWERAAAAPKTLSTGRDLTLHLTQYFFSYAHIMICMPEKPDVNVKTEQMLILYIRYMKNRMILKRGATLLPLCDLFLYCMFQWSVNHAKVFLTGFFIQCEYNHG